MGVIKNPSFNLYGRYWDLTSERNPVAKSKAQVEKQKRAAEKRKKIEKAVIAIAAGMPDDPVEQRSTVPATTTKPARNKS